MLPHLYIYLCFHLYVRPADLTQTSLLSMVLKCYKAYKYIGLMGVDVTHKHGVTYILCVCTCKK